MKICHSSVFFLFLLLLLACTQSKEEKSSNAPHQGDQYYALGEKFYAKNYDSSYINFNKALQTYTFNKDSINSSRSLIYLSIIQTIKGDYSGSELSAVEALNFLENKQNKDVKNLKTSIYNQIAINKEYQKDYYASINWYKKAITENNNQTDQLNLKNNLAVALYESDQYNASIKILDSLRQNTVLKNNNPLKAAIIDNLTYAKFLKNKNYNAEKELLEALKIRINENDLWGQNASYSHLSEYFEKKNNQNAIFYAYKMLENAKKLNSPDDRLEALEKLIALEESENSKKYFFEYQKLNDSLQTARSKARNQFALIRYGTEKAKTENIEKENHIFRQKVAIAFLVTGLLVGLFWYLRRKKRLEQEKEIEVKNTQIKYSKKIHDVVANGLYQTMVEVENQEELDKEKLLDKLEKMYEESRDIAHEDLNEQIEKEFSVKLFEMISSYSSPQQKVLVIGNEQNIWQNVSQNIQSEIFYALRELMINMKKHSQATLVSVKLEKIENILKIKYTDNGLGMGNVENKKLSGIKNTENRIENIGGDINFEKNLQKGLHVNISIPIH